MDGLLNDDAKFAQFDAEMRPVMEHDAQSFDFVVPSKRKNQVKRQFKALKEQDPKIYRDLKLFRTAIGLFSDNLFENSFVALVSKLSDPRKLASEGFGREHFYPLFMEILRFATMDMQMQSVLALIRKGASTYHPREVSDKHRIWMLRFEYAYITLRRASSLANALISGVCTPRIRRPGRALIILICPILYLSSVRNFSGTSGSSKLSIIFLKQPLLATDFSEFQ